MSAQDDVDIRLRLRGGKQAAAEAKGVGKAIDDLGRKSKGAGDRVGFLSAAGQGARRTLADLGGAARTGATWVTRLGMAAATYTAYSGLKFNATMEQNTVAFEGFLGSTEAAKKKLDELYEIAKATPFEFPELVEAQVRLMGFGMEAEKATKLLNTLGDALAGSGAGALEVQRATLALGQIQARGKVAMEELNQLAEARIPALEILRKELKLSRDELGQIGAKGIPAAKALDALERGLRKKYLGQAAKQAGTFNGQLSSLKDNFQQTVGAMTEGGFEFIRDEVLPALNDAAESVAETFRKTNLTTEQKLRESRQIVKRELGPVATDIQTMLRGAELGDKLASFVEMAAPKIADAAAKAAPKAAAAFVRAWWEMGPWGKLLTVGLLAKRFGVFTVLGDRAADRFTTAYSRGMNRNRARFSRMGSSIGRTFGGALGIAALLAANAHFNEATSLGNIKGGTSRGGVDDPANLFKDPGETLADWFKGLFGLAEGGRTTTAGAVVVGEKGPELVRLPKGAQVDPLPKIGPMVAPRDDRPQTIILQVDGREMTRVVARHVADRQNRR